MTPERQRIAIAEACGWYKIHGAEIYEWSWMNRGDGRGCNEIPDYPDDLNAMHEAEKTLHGFEWGAYVNWLSSIVVGRCSTINAPAELKAKAFLRAIGRWEE